MSKAFVKDDSLADQEFEFEPLELELDRYYVTPKGWSDLQGELENLRQSNTPDLDPQGAKTLKKRIHYLEKSMQKTEVIDPSQQTGERARFGATVTALDEDENTRVYKIVGITEVDSKSGKVSYISPIGKALLGAQIGDVVTIETPQAEEELEIVGVRFEALL